jgi:hemoglobin
MAKIEAKIRGCKSASGKTALVATLIASLLQAAACATTDATATAPASAATPHAAPATSGAAPAPASPAPAAAAAGPATGSLFERLGGKPAITAVVDGFVARVAADKRINLRFINTDIPQLKIYLVDFVCVATGGPCKYEGRDMHGAHAGMQLVDEEFTALVEDLVGALGALNVGAREQNEILGALGPLKGEIVEPPPPEAQAHDPATEKAAAAEAAALRASGHARAADLLEGATKARVRGQRNFAEILFSAAERESGKPAIPELAAFFRAGSPERVTTTLTTLPKNTPPQPKDAVGGSESDEPDAIPQRGSFSGGLRTSAGVEPPITVITLTPTKGKYRARHAKHRVIEQRDRQFAPRVMVVPVGSTVTFPNFDPVFHNVFSLSPARAFDLGIYKDGETREVTFNKEGVIEVGCNLHANMSATLIIVSAPHYVVTNAKGQFSFKSLALGDYQLKAWNEASSEPLTKIVHVKAGANNVTLDVAPRTGKLARSDKFGVPRGKVPF